MNVSSKRINARWSFFGTKNSCGCMHNTWKRFVELHNGVPYSMVRQIVFARNLLVPRVLSVLCYVVWVSKHTDIMPCILASARCCGACLVLCSSTVYIPCGMHLSRDMTWPTMTHTWNSQKHTNSTQLLHRSDMTCSPARTRRERHKFFTHASPF
jgi:hypothetical protein